MDSITNFAPAFESEAVFRRKLKSYIKHCNKAGEDEKKSRLPNAAGFCRFCSISREGFARLKEVYPLMYDIAQSTFLDEALNTKMCNSATVMSFLADFNSRIGEMTDEGGGEDTVRVISCHEERDAF